MAKQKDALITVSGLKKEFNLGSQVVQVLHGLDFTIYDGEFTVILGPSGCGKSTLLHILLGLEKPTEGSVKFFDYDVYGTTTEDERSDFRKSHVGMVYQQSNWIKALTVLENVAFPLMLLGREKVDAEVQAMEMIEKIGLGEWAHYIPTELSGGQQQRISVARALINNPQVIIADEPTGNLDFESGQKLMDLLRDLNEKEQKTVIMVTHDLDYVKYSNRAIKMFDGKIEEIIDDVQSDKGIQQLRSKRSILHTDENDFQSKPGESKSAIKSPKDTGFASSLSSELKEDEKKEDEKKEDEKTDDLKPEEKKTEEKKHEEKSEEKVDQNIVVENLE